MARAGLRNAGLGICLAGVVALVVPGASTASVFEVNTHADHKPKRCTKRDCTLREAIIRANGHDGPDTVRLKASKDPYALTRPGAGEDAGRKGDLDLGDSVRVKGRGPGKTVVVQREADRVFHVDSSAAFGSSVERLTIKGGNADNEAGGGILTEGRAFVGETKLVGNRAGAGAGAAAIGSASRLTLSQSTVTDNRADVRGGGVYLGGADGVAHGVTRSLIEGNRAPLGGGGIFFLPGDANLHVLSSTITANQSLGSPSSNGGGLYTEGTLVGPGIAKVEQVTIASNEAPPGGGSNIHAEADAQLENTLIGPDLGGGDSCDLAVDSIGHNLDQGTTCGLDQATDLENADGGLKALADNGGPTRTRGLTADSDALDEGACPGTILQLGIDQRGEGRPNVCDIGAFERDPLP